METKTKTKFKKTFSPDWLMDNKGCYSTEDVKSLSFYRRKRIHIKDLFKSELPIRDAYWFLFKKCGLTLTQKLSHCLELGKITLPIYEKFNPNDSRVKDCLNAVDRFNQGEITESELRKFASAASAAAYAASAAAYAADAAAYAADAYAADAAAYAADADADAAASAASAASAAASAASAASAAAYAAADADAAAYAAADAAADAADADAEFKQLLINCTVKFIDSL